MRAPVACCALALCCALAVAAEHMRFPRPPHDSHRPWKPQNSLCALHSVTPVSCASASRPHTLVPHPDDCRLFYYCKQPYLRPVCRQCPANLHFNPTRRVCDRPEQAGCSPTSTTTATEDTTTSTDGTTTSTDGTTTSTDGTTISTKDITTSTEGSTTSA